LCEILLGCKRRDLEYLSSPDIFPPAIATGIG